MKQFNPKKLSFSKLLALLNKRTTQKFIACFLCGFVVIISITLPGTIINHGRVIATNSPNQTEQSLSKPNNYKVGICVLGICVKTPPILKPIEEPINQEINSLAKEQLRSFLVNEIPISGTKHKLYPTSNELPGGNFRPKTLYLNNLNNSQAIPRGDYEIPVHFYCTKVYTFNGSGNRYRLARLDGKLSPALSTLYQRASLQNVPIQDVQVLSWSIQTGVSYDNLSDSSKALVNQLIPEYRQDLSGSFTDKTLNFWNSLSQTTALPSFNETLNGLGDSGKFVRSLFQAREEILRSNFGYRPLANSFVIQQDANLAGGIESTPWSQINEQVYLRFVAPRGALNDGIAQVRIVGESQVKALDKQEIISSLPGNNNRSASSVTSESLLSDISQSVGIPEASGHQAITATVLPAPEGQELRDAREIARRLREEYPGWKDKLNNCPCTALQAANNPNFKGGKPSTFLARKILKKYHPGAEFEYRTTGEVVQPYASPTKPEAPKLMPGQQCTYDAKGKLITGGAAAGTPDAYAPDSTYPGQGIVSNNSHTFWDVNPFDAPGMTWQEYQQTWIPNKGNGCVTNIVP